MDLHCLLLVFVGLIPQLGFSQTDVYCIGDEYKVTWDNTNSKIKEATKVDVVLTFGASNWTLSKDVTNNGSAMVGGHLGTSANQLSIANDTRGMFYVEGIVNHTTRSLFASNVTICQSVIFDTPGRAAVAGSHIRNVIVNLRQSTYVSMGGKSAYWQANFVSVDEETMSWKLEAALEFESSSPTKQPTTAPTETTTSTSTSTTSTTQAPPKPGQATQFFSTVAPNQEAGSESGNKLKLADALAKVSLGLDGNIEVGLSECVDQANMTQGWCQLNLTIKVPDDTNPGGPYDLVIGITPNSTDELQYYGANSDASGGNATVQFLAYNDSLVDLTLTLDKDDNNPNDTIYKYEAVGMEIDLGESGLNENVNIFVMATKRNSVQLDFRYMFECGDAHTAKFYTAFGWKTWEADFRGDRADFPAGTYDFTLYWAVDNDYSNVIDNEYYAISSVNLPQFHIHDDKNGTVLPPVQIKGDKSKFSRGHNNIEFLTSFNQGTYFEGYITQCNITCERYGNSTFNFTTDSSGSTKVKVYFPDNLYDTSHKDNSSTTWLNVSTILCDDVTKLTTTILLEIGNTGNNNGNGLSAGAIVGIVCAGVLVLGLAAWWLCMKKSGGDGYRELNE